MRASWLGAGSLTDAIERTHVAGPRKLRTGRDEARMRAAEERRVAIVANQQRLLLLRWAEGRIRGLSIHWK